MRYIILFISIVISAQSANQIFEEKDIQNVVDCLLGSNYKLKTSAFGNGRIVNAYYIADIDSDGENEFLINARSGKTDTILLLDKSFQLKSEFYEKLERNCNNKIAKIIDIESSLPKILIYSFNQQYEFSENVVYYKNDRLINKSDNNLDLIPISVRIKAHGCYGFCPSYTIQLFKQNVSYFIGNNYVYYDNNPLKPIKKKNFIIKESDWEIIENKIDNNELFWYDDDLRALASDYPTLTVEIIYQDGLTKRIDDYGMLQNNGFNFFYNLYIEIIEKYLNESSANTGYKK